MNVYVVTMYRFASRESHSYVIGVYSTLAKAKRSAKRERMYRGDNKYFEEIVEMQVDDMRKRETVLPLSKWTEEKK